MSYTIPSDKKVISSLRRVLKKAHIVQTQRYLRELVLNELQKEKASFRVSAKRLRLLALNSSFVKVEIQSREGSPNKSLHRCPVCHYALKRVKNLTIWGGIVTIELQCPHCGYWTGKKKRIPTRYVFHYRTG
ncbi:MAG: hypothetical protein KGY50_01680 [Candidatus Thermoplasmatota archaeon]|nr:hypothetical protein [Candidatus Thermoplasmatota archaeon]